MHRFIRMVHCRPHAPLTVVAQAEHASASAMVRASEQNRVQSSAAWLYFRHDHALCEPRRTGLDANHLRRKTIAFPYGPVAG